MTISTTTLDHGGDTAADQAQPITCNQESSIEAVDQVIHKYYTALIGSVHAALAVCGAMALKGRTKPLSLIFETASGYGKTATLQMTFPLAVKDEEKGVNQYIYRSDKFTPSGLTRSDPVACS